MSQSAKPQEYRQIPYYAQDVDFDDLAEHDPDWARICKSGKTTKWIDFQDPQTVLQLTKSLLKRDFNLTLTLPPDRLCPPVPVRWNYVRWIQDLLDTTSPNYTDRYDPQRVVVGLDIGTGASAIYPLLAASTRPEWRLAGTDVDAHSLRYARENVDANGLSKRVRLFPTATDAPLVPLEVLGVEELDFVMTNPPFYDSEADMQASYNGKTAPPSAVCTGAENEMICPGGDVGFVMRIVEESVVLGDKVQWYTAMLGKLASLQQIVAELKKREIANFAVTCLQAGHRTRRWAVGWSFGELRPRNDVARHGDLVHAVLPYPTAQTIAVGSMDSKQVGEKVDEAIRELDVRWQWRPSILTGVMEAKGNVWSRAARRKKQFRDQQDASKEVTKGDEDALDSDGEEVVALAAKVTAADEKVEVRWLRGSDYVLFESFCGVLKRALTARE